MSRARDDGNNWQTASAYERPGGGCLSGFMLPPLTVLLIGGLFAILAFKSPTETIATRRAAITNSAQLSPIFTPEVQFWRDSIARWATATNIVPNLVATIMQIESCGNPAATSSAGAMGLFQVMPYHFYAGDDPYAPDTNAARGLTYLNRSLSAAGNDVRLALAGYNGGIGVISSAEWAWPAETVRYTYWGSGIYQDALSGAASSARLGEWLNAGGASLCRQARQKLAIK